jgi:RNA polymerase sigma-70 factor (ECF subfamily)
MVFRFLKYLKNILFKYRYNYCGKAVRVKMNHAQYGDVVKQYEKLIYTICYQLTNDHFIAEDLTQETFIAAYTHWQNCPQNAIKAWLCRIAINKTKDYLKSAYNRRIATHTEPNLPENATVLYAQSTQPEDLTISKEESQIIKNYICTLKEPYLAVAMQFFIEELDISQISQNLNRPTKTVRTQIYRAKNMLRQMLKGEPHNGVV